MLKVDVYSAKGVKTGSFNLPKEYQEEVNLNLLAQVRRVYEDGMHTGLRKAKTRSEVIRVKQKIYKQKGTGRARHGSKNAPIFVGGGAAFGPRPVKRTLDLPKKLKVRALRMAISLKAKDSQVVLVSGVEKIKKTKEAASLIDKISKDTKNRSLTYACSDGDLESLKFFRNIEKVSTTPFSSVNAFTVLKSGVLLIDKNVFEKAKKEKTEKSVKEKKVKKTK